jgi:hypothetical protein
MCLACRSLAGSKKQSVADSRSDFTIAGIDDRITLKRLLENTLIAFQNSAPIRRSVLPWYISYHSPPTGPSAMAVPVCRVHVDSRESLSAFEWSSAGRCSWPKVGRFAFPPTDFARSLFAAVFDRSVG